MIQMPFNVTNASEATILSLIDTGIIEVMEDGLHVAEKIPVTTTNQNRDK